jgi:hypothetical protein
MDARQRQLVFSQRRTNRSGSWTATIVCLIVNLTFPGRSRVPLYAPSYSNPGDDLSMYAVQHVFWGKHDWVTVIYSVAIEETHKNTVQGQSACPHRAEAAILTFPVPFRSLLHLLSRSKLLYNCCHIPREACNFVLPSTHK